MMGHRNRHGQPVGEPLANWSARPVPERRTLRGRLVRVEPLVPVDHGASLYEAFSVDAGGAGWTYMAAGPFADRAAFDAWLAAAAAGDDPLFFALVDAASGRALGVASYLRIDPPHGVLEVGNIHFAPELARTTAATEAMYLMMRHAFDELGYRRCEWKCDALNAPSRRAATRLGFTFEGIFRQALVVKGRNRDTAWYALIDRDWPARRAAFEAWLAPANFDSEGRQRRHLAAAVE